MMHPRKWRLAVAGAAIVATTLWLSAQPSDPDTAATDDASGEKVSCCAVAEPSLGRTVRLEFKVEHEDEVPRFPIVSAGGDFEVTREEMGPEFEHHMTLRGEVLPVDDRDQALVRFEASTGHSEVNEGHEGTFSASGSAVVTLGKEIHLADLGEAPLKLTVTVVE